MKKRKFRVGDRVRIKKLSDKSVKKIADSIIGWANDMDSLLGARGTIDMINTDGLITSYHVNGWYWPASALLKVKK